MGEYIERETLIKKIKKMTYNKAIVDFIMEQPSADVQPVDVVSEHIKNRLYETALNTKDEKDSDTIAAMAERIDFWINELKGR